MNSPTPYFVMMVTVAALLIAFAVVFFVRRKRGIKTPPDYRMLFIAGAAYLPLGIVMESGFFIVMAIVLMGVGLMHRKEWRPTEETPPMKRLLAYALLALLIAAVAAALIVRAQG